MDILRDDMAAAKLELFCPKCGASLDISNDVSEMVNRKAEAATKQQVGILLKQEQDALLAKQDRAWEAKLGALEVQLAERDKKLLQAQTKAQALEAKLAQGSPSVRGIIAEQALYDFLAKNLPAGVCSVEKVGQGKKGTDVIINVLANGSMVGRIIVDSKWGQHWEPEWPEKVWKDMQDHKADFAYLAVGLGAFPPQLKEAGFGFAPCRRAGVKVGVVDSNNLPFVLAVLSDTIEKVLKLAETKAMYGSGSPAFRQLQEYLSGQYETDLREKARLMSEALKSLNDMREKFDREFARMEGALSGYWRVEGRVFKSIANCFDGHTGKELPEIPQLPNNQKEDLP